MNIHKIRPFSLALAVLWSASSGAADDEDLIADLDETLAEYLQLWANCTPVHLLSVGLDDEAEGMLGDAVETTVRSRLRSARLFNDGQPIKGSPFLSVVTEVLPDGKTFLIQFRLHKFTVDAVWPTGPDSYPEGLNSNFVGPVVTWDKTFFGTRGDRNSIMARVSELTELTDKFIDEYLRVNADACEG